MSYTITPGMKALWAKLKEGKTAADISHDHCNRLIKLIPVHLADRSELEEWLELTQEAIDLVNLLECLHERGYLPAPSAFMVAGKHSAISVRGEVLRRLEALDANARKLN